MSNKSASGYQFSIGTLFLVTVLVAIWILGFVNLLAKYPKPFSLVAIFQSSLEVLGTTLALSSSIFVIYGILLYFVLVADERAQTYYRSALRVWSRISLMLAFAVGPWFVKLIKGLVEHGLS